MSVDMHTHIYRHQHTRSRCHWNHADLPKDNGQNDARVAKNAAIPDWGSTAFDTGAIPWRDE